MNAIELACFNTGLGGCVLGVESQRLNRKSNHLNLKDLGAAGAERAAGSNRVHAIMGRGSPCLEKKREDLKISASSPPYL